MTQKEFFAALREIKGFKLIGGYIRKGKACPIVAVANKLTGKRFRTDYYELASQELKLNSSFVECVVCASDRRDCEEHCQSIRRKILDAVNLDDV